MISWRVSHIVPEAFIVGINFQDATITYQDTEEEEGFIGISFYLAIVVFRIGYFT